MWRGVGKGKGSLRRVWSKDLRLGGGLVDREREGEDVIGKCRG